MVSVGGQTIRWTSLVGGRQTARMTVGSASGSWIPTQNPPHQPGSCSGITSLTSPTPDAIPGLRRGRARVLPLPAPHWSRRYRPLLPSPLPWTGPQEGAISRQPSLGPGKSALSQTPWSLDPLGFPIRSNPGPFQRGTPGVFPSWGPTSALFMVGGV